MADKTLVLVCNSHIDPVWLWPWEEGLAVTLSTFRAAADLCEEFDGFVFCHNEALLYEWVEQYEPALFARIQRLVRDGRWHVMGGWYLQPDCNLPSGESLVRQVLVGKRYFMEKFGVEPRVAVNFNPFGHTRGLPQILKKSGYDGYLFCRPDRVWLDLPSDDFVWVGYDGSTVLAHRASEHYNSEMGKARAKVERWLVAHPERSRGLLLWGVGNHGGGPSRQDLRALADQKLGSERFFAEPAERPLRPQFRHGTPEDYFVLMREDAGLPRWEHDLNPWAVGCYTSMATVKRAHARLERSLFVAESMLANAAAQGLLPYPLADLRAALADLLYCQFHDVLPGEGIRTVEQQALDRLGHGQEIVGRLRAKAFFAYLRGQPIAADGEFPLFVHNHHPFPVSRVVSCEFQPPEPNFNPEVFWQPRLTDSQGRDVPLQLEKESCNIQNDHRKRVVFRASLPPSSTSRFSCRLEPLPRNGDTSRFPENGDSSHFPMSHFPMDRFASRNGKCHHFHVSVSASTGLLTRFAVGGFDYLAGPAFRPLLVKDTADPWGMKTRAFREVVGEFTLMSPARAAAFAGVSAAELAPVRVIEDGPVRTTVEALLECGRSAIAIRYTRPAVGTGIEVELRVAWFERDTMLKLAVPTTLDNGEVRAQTAYGNEIVRARGEETVGHRWLALLSPDGGRALTLVNDTTYGFDVAGGEIRLSLLRAPAYAGHPVDDVTPIVRQDRFEPREDQGEHAFRFWLDAGPAGERLAAIDREAAIHTEGLMALCAFPSGEGTPPLPGVLLDDEVVRLSALKNQRGWPRPGPAAVRADRLVARHARAHPGPRPRLPSGPRPVRTADAAGRSRDAHREPSRSPRTPRGDAMTTRAGRPVRVLISAIGGYGHYYLQTLLEQVPADRAVLAGVVDPQARQARAWPWVESRGAPVFDDMESFYSAGHEADLAVIVSPIQFHVPQSCTALEHGSHVLCDKPLGATIQDAARLVAARDRAGRFVMIGYQWSVLDGHSGVEGRHPRRPLRPAGPVLDALLLAETSGVLSAGPVGGTPPGSGHRSVGARRPGEQRDGAFPAQPALPRRAARRPQRRAAHRAGRVLPRLRDRIVRHRRLPCHRRRRPRGAPLRLARHRGSDRPAFYARVRVGGGNVRRGRRRHHRAGLNGHGEAVRRTRRQPAVQEAVRRDRHVPYDRSLPRAGACRVRA